MPESREVLSSEIRRLYSEWLELVGLDTQRPLVFRLELMDIQALRVIAQRLYTGVRLHSRR
jgi:hypothetical protein